MSEKANSKAPKTEQISGKERFERRQAAKRTAVENHPDAIVFVPESPIARKLVNAIMLIDSADAIMRSQAGLNIDFKDFESHITFFKEAAEKLETSGKAMLNLIAANEKIQPRSIRNRFTRKAVEDMRKNNKKPSEPDSAKSAEGKAKEGEPSAPTTKK